MMAYPRMVLPLSIYTRVEKAEVDLQIASPRCPPSVHAKDMVRMHNEFRTPVCDLEQCCLHRATER